MICNDFKKTVHKHLTIIFIPLPLLSILNRIIVFNIYLLLCTMYIFYPYLLLLYLISFTKHNVIQFLPQFQFSFESPALFVCCRNKSKLLKYSECQHSNFQWKHGAESCKLQKSSNLPSFYEYSQVNSSQKTKLSFLWKLKILLAVGC